MKVPLLDLKLQYQGIRDEVMSAITEVCDSQQFILGDFVEKLEQDIAEYCGVDFSVGVSSGTDALLISLMAEGVSSGDRVLTSPYTFFATGGCIARVGATPVFVDIDPETYNLSPQCLQEAIAAMAPSARKRLRAVIPVHLYGQCADMDPILEMAGSLGIPVIEDAAQAIGAVYRGRPAGAIGQYGCFSFFPSKNLGGFGDGGIVTTSSAESAEKLRVLRVHGTRQQYHHAEIGGNFRLDALQAAVVAIKLRFLDDWTEKRRWNASVYRALFQECGLLDQIDLPVEKQDRHVFNQFVIRVRERRDELKSYLQSCGVGSAVYYPLPLHMQKCFSSLGYRSGDFPVAEHAALHTLALPIFPELTEAQLEYVVGCIGKFFTAG